MKRRVSRRGILKESTIALGAIAVCDVSGIGSALAARQDISQVFFTKDIGPAGLLKIYSKINQDITGKVGIKVHTGEPHNLKERIESRKGLRQLSYMKEMNMGNDRYELLTL